MNGRWVGVILGAGLLHNGLWKLIAGEDGLYWDFSVPAWTGWIQAFLGLYFLLISFRAIFRGDGKPPQKKYTPQDIAAAKAELDRLYLKEHGVLPDYPKEAEADGQEGREPAGKV